MHKGSFVYTQLTSHIDRNKFNYLVRKYQGDSYIKHFTCWNQLKVLMFGQLSRRESLRDLIVAVEAHSGKAKFLGFGDSVTRSNLAKANQNRDYRIFEEVIFSTDTGMNSKDIFDVYRTRFPIEFLYRDSKQFTGLCNCQSRDVKAMDFAFNMSLSTINVAGQFGKEYDVDLSVNDVKMLLHNAAMVERIFSTFGKSPNLMKNNTDFKELLFYGLRAAI